MFKLMLIMFFTTGITNVELDIEAPRVFNTIQECMMVSQDASEKLGLYIDAMIKKYIPEDQHATVNVTTRCMNKNAVLG